MKVTSDQYRVRSASGLTCPELSYALEHKLVHTLHSGIPYENPYFTDEVIHELKVQKSRGVFAVIGTKER